MLKLIQVLLKHSQSTCNKYHISDHTQDILLDMLNRFHSLKASKFSAPLHNPLLDLPKILLNESNLPFP